MTAESASSSAGQPDGDAKSTSLEAEPSTSDAGAPNGEGGPPNDEAERSRGHAEPAGTRPRRLDKADGITLVSGATLAVALFVLALVFEGRGDVIARLELPVRSERVVVSMDPQAAAERVVLSPELLIDRLSVLELQLEREGGKGRVSVDCALVGREGAVHEVALGSGSADVRSARAWIDRIRPGVWVLRAETVWSAIEPGDAAPRLLLTATLGRRSPYGWMIAASLIALPPVFVLLRALVRWRRRRRGRSQTGADR